MRETQRELRHRHSPEAKRELLVAACGAERAPIKNQPMFSLIYIAEAVASSQEIVGARMSFTTLVGRRVVP